MAYGKALEWDTFPKLLAGVVQILLLAGMKTNEQRSCRKKS